MEIKEQRIRSIMHIYYSNPKVQEAIVKFAQNREVVPRYYEGFGKRPDVIQYPSDIMGLVKKGATSFHSSEEIWRDPLAINSDMGLRELNELRASWDLLIDVDSKYLDVSKVLTKLIAETLESFGIKNYGIKFSGSKGFHVIVSGKAFPKEFDGMKMEQSFPEWPRAICEYLTHVTRKEFNKRVGEIFQGVKVEKKVENDKSKEALCPECGRPARKGNLVVLECPVCKTSIQRKDMKVTKKRLKCVQEDCAGVFEIKEEKDYFQCDYCQGVSSISKTEEYGRGKNVFTKEAKDTEDYSKEIKEEFAGTYFGASDLVLVASRHLFRMPYSLHEKTALASVVLTKDELDDFKPSDADPMKVKIREYLPDNKEGEASRLLSLALEWQKSRKAEERVIEDKKYAGRTFEETDLKNVTDNMFPPAIKKLLEGLEDGRKRGLFVLLTFLKSTGFSAEEINKRVKEWNEKNKPPLREGYVKSQIDWHLKQKKKILPPNYANDAFYRDIGLIKDKPKNKNPLVDVKNALWRSGRA
jgi:DNA primase catalytic subunit